MQDSYDFLRKLEQSQTLINVLMAFEDWIDSLDMYAFDNWFNGEVIEGPIIERYWVTVALKYDYKDMPDPTGGKRMIKNGAKVKFIKAKQELYLPNKDDIDLNPEDTQELTNQPYYQESNEDSTPEPKHKDIWIIIIKLPRRFVEEVIEADLEEFEEYLDVEDVSDARDEGLNDESEFVENEVDEEEIEDEEDLDAAI